MRASDRRGFSLAEVLMAVALLGFLGLGAMMLFGVLVDNSTESRDKAAAHLLATQRLEEHLAAGYAAHAAGTVLENPIAGHAAYQRRTTISQEGADLLRIRVAVYGRTAADSLSCLLANR